MKRLLVVACLLSVELLAEGLDIVNNQYRFAGAVGPEFLLCHWGLIRPWRLPLIRRLHWVNEHSCLLDSWRLSLHGGGGGDDRSGNCLVIFDLNFLPPLGIFFATCIAVDYAEEMLDHSWFLAGDLPCEFAFKQAGGSSLDDGCFRYVLYLAPCLQRMAHVLPCLLPWPLANAKKVLLGLRLLIGALKVNAISRQIEVPGSGYAIEREVN